MRIITKLKYSAACQKSVEKPNQRFTWTRGLWACIGTRAPFHMEGGQGTTSKVMKFQLRPDPLAR